MYLTLLQHKRFITQNVTTTWNISETTVYIAAQLINTLISISKQSKQTVISTRNAVLLRACA